MILWHGTTRLRAEAIIRDGPDSGFLEPGGEAMDSGYSMNVADGPFLFGHPRDYAFGKALAFPAEGGPAIVEVDVPDEILSRAVNEWFPIEQGLVQFDRGAGLEELLAAWPNLTKSSGVSNEREHSAQPANRRRVQAHGSRRRGNRR